MDIVRRLSDVTTNASPATVVRWVVDVGQPLRRGQPFVEVDTDQSVMEVE
jgi:pyruvate/2-oxoglutarate dehydrogenase complex dihydrolipoamide acyltransferase (E2) component